MCRIKYFLLFIWLFFTFLIHFNYFSRVGCYYDNTTYGINESVDTFGCKLRWTCQIVNGTLIAKCKTLCQIMFCPKRDPKTKIMGEYPVPLNLTACNYMRIECVQSFHFSFKDFVILQDHSWNPSPMFQLCSFFDLDCFK